MHGAALLDRWRGLVFALHVTLMPAPSLLIIKLLLLHHTTVYQGRLVELAVCLGYLLLC